MQDFKCRGHYCKVKGQTRDTDTAHLHPKTNTPILVPQILPGQHFKGQGQYGKVKSQIKTRKRTHLWPDAGCIHRQRPTNIV